MSRTLLLADDSLTMQKVVALTLAREGLEITAVNDGEAAVAKAQELLPDLVIADVVMPKMSGYEVCEALKKNPRTSHIPVLLLTGSFEAFDEARSQQVGADGHVVKPFESKTLIEAIQELLAKSKEPAAQTKVAGEPASEQEADTLVDFDLEPIELDSVDLQMEFEDDPDPDETPVGLDLGAVAPQLSAAPVVPPLPAAHPSATPAPSAAAAPGPASPAPVAPSLSPMPPVATAPSMPTPPPAQPVPLAPAMPPAATAPSVSATPSSSARPPFPASPPAAAASPAQPAAREGEGAGLWAAQATEQPTPGPSFPTREVPAAAPQPSSRGGTLSASALPPGLAQGAREPVLAPRSPLGSGPGTSPLSAAPASQDAAAPAKQGSGAPAPGRASAPAAGLPPGLSGAARPGGSPPGPAPIGMPPALAQRAGLGSHRTATPGQQPAAPGRPGTLASPVLSQAPPAASPAPQTPAAIPPAPQAPAVAPQAEAVPKSPPAPASPPLPAPSAASAPRPEESKAPTPEAQQASGGGEAAEVEALRAALAAASKETIEKVVWEVVPELAETLLREAIETWRKERGSLES